MFSERWHGNLKEYQLILNVIIEKKILLLFTMVFDHLI